MLIQVNPAYDADGSIMKAELKSYLGTGLIISQIVQADMQSATTGVITAGSAPTVDPNAGWFNPGVSAGATRLLALYHGGVTRAVGIPWGYTPWGSLPATGDIDERYRVTDLQTLVGYRDTATDEVLAGTGNSLAGWHPLAGGYALFDNQSGATINHGEAVEIDESVSPTRRVKQAANLKSPSVIGVAMHTVASGNPIVVALLGCQDVVQVKVDPTITAGGAACEIVSGDLLVVGSAAGVCRSVGQFPTNPHPTSSTVSRGLPMGAFAVALKDRVAGDGVGLVPARLLASIGTGRTVSQFMGATPAYRDLTSPGGAFYPGRSSTNNNGGQAATEDLLISTKHSPILGATLSCDFEGDSGTAGIAAQLVFAKDGTNPNAFFVSKRYSASPHVFREDIYAPTGTDSRTTLIFLASGGSYTSPLTSFALYLKDYTY